MVDKIVRVVYYMIELEITVEQTMDFVMTMMVYTQGIGT